MRNGRDYRVRCQSGLMGTRCRLQTNYEGGLLQFRVYSEMYGLAKRLGYRSHKAAWEANPVIEFSSNPGDFRKVRD